jgi:ribonuclease P protein component
VVRVPCRPRAGDPREAYLSTKCPPSCQDTPVGLIDSIRDRDVFVRLGRDGVRFRREPLWCTYLQPIDQRIDHVPKAPRYGTPASCRFAFAIGRPVGPAVVRNRLRRRLRVIVRENDFPPGYWLIGARPRATELTFDQLRSTMLDLATAVARSLDQPPRPIS